MTDPLTAHDYVINSVERALRTAYGDVSDVWTDWSALIAEVRALREVRDAARYQPIAQPDVEALQDEVRALREALHYTAGLCTCHGSPPHRGFDHD